MDFRTIDWSNYQIEVTFCEDHVTIRDNRYSPESVNPSGEGRFHRLGQATYYLGSGLNVADAEASGTQNPQVFHPKPGAYRMADLVAAGTDFPEFRESITASRGDGGWEYGQEVRVFLESIGISGCRYESTVVPGEENLALWRLDHQELGSGYFGETWKGQSRIDKESVEETTED